MINQYQNKYTGSPNVTVSNPARVLGARVRSVVLVALIIAVVVLGVVGGQAIAYRSKCEPTFISRMQTECDEAIGSINTLSRSGGAESAAILGKIRGNIRAIEAINEIANTVAGGDGYLVPPQTFVDFYAIIDSYSNKLKLGNVIVEDQAKLATALTNLQLMLEALN